VKPTFGSLFSGAGGFDLGMEQAGWECKFQVEWDKHCRSVLDHHWSDVEKWSDIRNVNGRFVPPVDCIVFGSPCQDLSHSKKGRAGLEGERSGLFFEAIRIIKEMKDATGGTFPKYSIWENVAGALSSNNGHDFKTVINEMVEAGANLQEYAVLDAKYFGVPQQRRRVYLASVFSSAAASNCPEPLLPVREVMSGDFAKGRRKQKDSSSPIEESVGAGVSTISTNMTRVLGSSIVGTLTASDFKGPGNQYVMENKCVVEPFDPTDSNSEDVLRVRRLTPLEHERLQGFPDDHTRWGCQGLEISDGQRYKMIGNAVAVPVVKWVGEQLMNVHRATYPVTPIG
jgi:DNA (cytosine-5)-methyltransferase 1